MTIDEDADRDREQYQRHRRAQALDHAERGVAQVHLGLGAFLHKPERAHCGEAHRDQQS